MLGEREQVNQVLLNSTLPYNNLQQTVALGILALAKHDRAESKHGEGYTSTQLAAADAFTTGELDRFREEAGVMLGQYAVILAAQAPSESGKPRGWAAVREWFWGFGQGYASAVFWSLSLIAIAILAKLGGHDLIDILREALRPD